LPADFRALPKAQSKPFSAPTLLALRRARRLQRLIADLVPPLERRAFAVGTASLTNDPDSLAATVRREMNVPVEDQVNWLSETVALAEWRRLTENAGVFVFELGFPLEEGRAFSLADSQVPAIVLNGRDAVTGRVFSLFHEFAHLLVGHGGICDFSEEGKTEEQFCNRFAGSFLVPAESLLSEDLLVRNPNRKRWEDEDLQVLAGRYKVSREVILRRLLTLGHATQEFYSRKHEEWAQQADALRGKRRGGRAVPARQCVRQNGIPFTLRVLESAAQGKITYRDVSDFLNVSLKHLPQVEMLVREGGGRYG